MKSFRLLNLSLIQSALLFGYCFGGDTDVAESAVPVKWDFAKWCEASGHKFTFETATFTEVTVALGSGQIVNVNADDPGDADPLWAVYYLSGKNVVRFEADGDMGGPEHRITGISVGPATDFPVGPFPSIDARVDFCFGHVGMDISKLKKQMGSGKLQGNKAVFQYSGTTEISSRSDLIGDSKKFDVTGYLSIGVRAGRVVKIEMSHITTD